MKKILMIAVLLGTQVSFGGTRADLGSMTTSEARQLVGDRGAVIFNSGKRTYERVVKNVSYCELGEVTRFFYGQTADDNSAIVGKTCENHSR